MPRILSELIRETFVSLVVKYSNHKVHKDLHKGHKEECQSIVVLLYISKNPTNFPERLVIGFAMTDKQETVDNLCPRTIPVICSWVVPL